MSAFATLLLLVCDARGWKAGVWIFKPLASAAFVAAGLAAASGGGASAYWILAGLILGALGDVLLIPHGRAPFLAGLVSFLLGHVAYIAAFVSRGTEPLGLTLLAAPLLLAVSGLIGRWLLPNVESGMKAPVLAYIVVISVMVYAALGTARLHGETAWLGAAVAFYLSDLSVARDRFVATGFANRLWGLPLYYGAQIVLALTLH